MNIEKSKEINVKWSDLHADIFKGLISEFKKGGIKYFILRNYEGLPEINSSKDIDIIIEPGSYEKASNLLYSIFKRRGISNYYVAKFERTHCWYGIDNDNNFTIHIDLIEGYLTKGFEIFSFDRLYNNTKDYNGFKVLNDIYDALMLLYYKLIAAKKLKKKYQNKIQDIYKRRYAEINALINETAGNELSSVIINALKKNDYEKIENKAYALSKETKKKVFLKNPFQTIVRMFRFLVEKFHRIVICPNNFQKFISVQGPDGSGKSTFINGLMEAIEYYWLDNTKTHVYHHRPKILPNLGAVGEKAGVKKHDKNFTKPHRAKPAGRISSFFRMGYYWLDYVIGVPIKLRKDVQFDRFTVYDRYIYDFLIDPHRSRINLPYWVRNMFSKLVPQPQIVFVLLTNAETIYQRKQELSPDEIKRQLKELRKLAESDDRFVVLDADQPPEQLVEDGIKIIIERFTKKVQ